MERRVVLAFVVGLLIIGIPMAAQSYILNRQFLGLENELAELQMEIAALKEGTGINSTETKIDDMQSFFNFTSDWMNFTFTWGPDSQRIIQGTLRLTISLRRSTSWIIFKGEVILLEELLHIIVDVNDDDYCGWDYLGLVFDTNQNDVIDIGSVDDPHLFLANNMSVYYSRSTFLRKDGLLGWAQVRPLKEGLHTCTFDPTTGYTFKTSYREPELKLPNYSTRLHVCFYDVNAPSDNGVCIQFLFIPPVKDSL